MITNQKAFHAAIARERKAGTLTRARAICYQCLDCVGYTSGAIAACTNQKCPLWEYRTGKYTPLGEKAVEHDG